MGVEFPGESNDYREARDRLLEQEVELRRTTEAVAAARRRLPPGGVVAEDYVFKAQGPRGEATDVRLSELFAPGQDSLVIYSMVFPRARDDDRLGPEPGGPRCCPSLTAPAHRVPLSSTSLMVRPSTCRSASTSPSSAKRQ
jgi:predicted dithiol-disulfide oxidoreductase (DUF899 family)